jgi:hypothetical protein
MVWGDAGSSLSPDGLRTEDGIFTALQKVWAELDKSVTSRLVASFRRRLEVAVRVLGNPISHLQWPRMSPRPHRVWEGESSPFTHEDDPQLRDPVQRLGYHRKRIADEVEFSSPLTTLEPGMRHDCLEGQERNEWATLLERECINADRPLDGMQEVCLPTERGDDAELARVRAPHWEFSEDDWDPPRYAPASPGCLAFRCSRVAGLRAAGDRRSLPHVV